jgi:hypothetical protein
MHLASDRAQARTVMCARRAILYISSALPPVASGHHRCIHGCRCVRRKSFATLGSCCFPGRSLRFTEQKNVRERHKGMQRNVSLALHLHAWNI